MNNLKDRRGYMLVEIILAFAIAFSIAAALLNLTIKLKNKNDDMLIKSQVETDRAIIANKLYKYVYEKRGAFSCDSISIKNNAIYYDTELIDTLSDKYSISYTPADCKNENNLVSVTIKVTVPQLGNKSYNININYAIPQEPETAS